ncbi:MAG: protein-glutamate O-methyltransferase CheR [Sorangiineae bacterium]|nr:protein-glutamate O-methyltransferase CheR [Polyangiaceae bacterium]MEB2321427.1 protein-glutamate O-methyltransferase CheR [Sorangiineae bacterium]
MSLRLEPRPRLTRDAFRLLRDLVNDYAGLTYDDAAMYAFDRRLGERVLALELGSFDEYYKYLRFHVRGAAELDEAVELLTTKETYFFRQEYQLRAFEKEVLPKIAAANASRRRISVWSAGCSTGEEAYTLAMILDRSGLFDGWDARVMGSDISKQNIAHARRGVYRSASFRVIEDNVRRAYFTPTAGGAEVIADRVKQMCHFGQMNLLDASRAAVVGRVDAVFCRNVLIYFDLRSRRRVIDSLYDRLVPGGYLMLGHSESLLNLSTAFELVHLEEDLVYRKPLAAQRWDGVER